MNEETVVVGLHDPHEAQARFAFGRRLHSTRVSVPLLGAQNPRRRAKFARITRFTLC
jgi:hypothetical protein